MRGAFDGKGVERSAPFLPSVVFMGRRNRSDDDGEESATALESVPAPFRKPLITLMSQVPLKANRRGSRRFARTS
jgi:hypothetical protein